MLFNSYIFVLIFLPVTIVIYEISKRYFTREIAFIFLILFSLIYYAYWKVSYLPILLLSIIFNFYSGKFLSKQKNKKIKKITLIVSIIVNLTALGYYKYASFILNNISTLYGTEYNSLNIVLPLAISFFTFQQIAYLVDAYRGEVKEYSFTHYCLFVTFFPQLIAGPIVHHKEVLPQFMNKAAKLFDQKLFWLGLMQFILGLSKKVLIADTVAQYATPVFSAADAGLGVQTSEAWIAILAYSFQLYFDFSAYSDMAIGIGKMFGINLPINFNSPYKATSIIDFWRRWHITLSHFLRDYLYFALGGNKKGRFRRYVNLFLTMLLGGLWHGASWNFVIWGGMHGLYLIINNIWHKILLVLKLNYLRNSPLVNFLAKALTFFAVIEAWVLFRAESFQGARTIYIASFGGGPASNLSAEGTPANYIADPEMAIAIIVACSIIVFTLPNIQQIITKLDMSFKEIDLTIAPKNIYSRNWSLLIVSGVLSAIFVITLSSMNKISEFLYFQF